MKKQVLLSLPLLTMLVGQAYANTDAELRGAFLLGNTGPALTAACEANIKTIEAGLADIRKLPLNKVNEAGLLARWNQVSATLRSTSGTASLQNATATDKAVRDAGKDCMQKLSGFSTNMYQDEALYQRFQAYKPADAFETGVREDMLDSFVSSGIALPADKRAQFKSLSEQITKLASEFRENVANDEKQVISLTAKQVDGVPAAFLARIPKNDKGEYQFKLNGPARENIATYAKDANVRKQFFVLGNQRGGERNLAILDELQNLRRQQAQLLGYASFADWALKDRMAGNVKTVNDFLADVSQKVVALEKKEIADLESLKKGDPDAFPGKLERWDVAYYQNKLKELDYQLDQNDVRKAFPSQMAVDWMLDVSSKLYGVRFAANSKLPVWHEEVKAYDVFDGNDYVGSFYVDLYPRDDKYGHAAAWGVRSVSTELGSKPVSVLVTNFDRNGLNVNELETLYHEFGHVLHGVLSKTRYAFHGGTAVKRDFVEAPSQMFEEWAFRPETVALMPKPVDKALLGKIKAAQNYGAGMRYARQALFARFDMALTTPEAKGTLATWQAMEKTTLLGHVDGTRFPAAFNHIASGYTAGYYSYMWSEVMALDMRSAFGDNFMDAKVGKRYRDTILARGGEENPAKLVEAFLGRKPNAEAFIKQITGK